MARKKEKAYYPMEELLKACDSVYNAIILARECGKTYAMIKQLEKKKKEGGESNEYLRELRILRKK